jgi:hypothetical protein
VEWYDHLRKIDESARANAVVTSTARAVARCVVTAAGSQEPESGIWLIVDAFVKHRFGVHAEVEHTTTADPAT